MNKFLVIVLLVAVIGIFISQSLQLKAVMSIILLAGFALLVQFMGTFFT